METRELSDNIAAAAEILAAGGLVAVPTETVYGLAANGFDGDAVAKIYALKGRAEDKPLSLMVKGTEAFGALCEAVPKAAYLLADIFWPGPLTIVLKAKNTVPGIVRAGGGTVGLRCPDHPKLRQLLEAAAFPLAAPSANLSGEKSPVSAECVRRCFDGKIAGIIDGGVCVLGRESTVIDLSKTPYTVLREGAVPSEDIFNALTASLTLIGITGGTGSGKTTALNVIREMCGLIIDADAVYHRLLAESAPMHEALDARFPGAIPPGNHDTKALGQIVFSDPDALRDLNAITHRFVGEEIGRLLSDWARRGNTLAAIDAIALIESKIGAVCRATVGIIAPRETRITRLMVREGLSRAYAELRISAQKPDSFFVQNCDYTVINDGTQCDFGHKCKELFEDIIRS
ncbi:MAG: threonylcarbamoyl-AMP synthase [Oscillospiraceae bacterium]|jgi:L-threonylcarbamoyladenylate synthase|nr:threonylcarbamoyl-AMP synthase [Oscillospiraceae bacterium]